MCVYVIMASQRERLERLNVLIKMKTKNIEDGCSEALNRHLLEEYMKSTWYLGHQTRMDYLGVLFV